MKAVVIREFGGPDVFSVVEIDPPHLGTDEVMVEVRATSVNPIDTKIRSGAVQAVAPQFPAILHGDLSGVVTKVGSSVTAFSPGDGVIGCVGGFLQYPGALREYVTVPSSVLAPAPSTGLSLSDAAGLSLVGITAWRAVFDRPTIVPGMHVLVHAGCGGVGHIALQLAKLAGAVVSTTISSEMKASIARSLGADNVIVYPSETVEAYVDRLTDGNGFDVVIDTVGNEVLSSSMMAVRRGGEVVTIAARSTQDLTAMHGKGLSLHAVFMILPFFGVGELSELGDTADKLARLVEQGKLTLLTDASRFDFTHVGAAHEHLEGGQCVGKVIVENNLV